MTPELESRIYASVLRSVLWGEPRDEILQMLATNGIVGETAEAMLRRALQERIAVLRAEAMRKAVKGAFLLGGGVTLFCVFWFGVGAIMRSILVICAVMGAWGIWYLIGGLTEALMAPSRQGPVESDV